MAENSHVASENQEIVQKKVRPSILDHFTHISNENEGNRLKNAVLLLKHLHAENKDDSETNEIKYALDRLIRGLGSSRNSARVGFYSTFVALLNVLPSVNVEKVLGIIQKQLQTGKNNSKSEIGDIYTGQTLACGALIRSGTFYKGSPEDQKKVVELLLHAGKQRSYLTSAASTFIIHIISTVEEEAFRTLFWPILKDELLKPWPDQKLDNVYLLILINNKFLKTLKGSSLKKCFGTRKLLCEENLKPLCDILLNNASISSIKHPAYAVISKEIAASELILPFMNNLNDQLVRVNRNRLLAVSIILQNILANLSDSSLIPKVLVSNFVSQMVQYFRYLHNVNHDDEFQLGMTKLFDSILNALRPEQVTTSTKISVLKTLLFYPGTFMIESITKSKILQQIVHELDAKGVKKLSNLYKGVLVAKEEKNVSENSTEPWLNAERVYAAQLLVKLLNHSSVQNEVEWKIKYLKLLINLSLVKHSKYANVGIELSGTIRETFFTALDQKFSKLEDMSTLLFELLNHITSLITPENYQETLRISLSEEEFSIFQQTYAIVSKSFNKEDKCLLVFQILFLQMGLQLFKDKDLATASLKELFLCYERVNKEKKEENDPEWIEVVVDLFLNLLSHSSHLLRNIIGSVFPYLCKYITPSSIHQILSVLDPNSDNQPLSTAGDSEEEESSDGSDNEEEVDVEEEEDEEDESENEDEFEENVNEKFRMAVREALGNDGCLTDVESVDLDEMSDSEGRRLDGALAHAFKQFKSNRGRNKKQSKNDATLTHFRVRAIDLIEIYLNSEPAMLTCLEIMPPLLQTLEFTIRDEHQKPLQARVKHCLKMLTNVKKFNNMEGVSEEILAEMFNSLLGKGTKSAMMIQDMSNEISDCCMFLIKCAQLVAASSTSSNKTKKKLTETFVEILSNAIKVYFNQRDCLIPYSLFKSTFQLNWEGNLILAPLLFEFIFNLTTRPFRRSQALELLKIFYLNRRLQFNIATFQFHLSEHETEFFAKLDEMFKEFCRDPQSQTIKERFIYHIFNLLKAMASHPMKNEQVDWKKVGENVREYRSFVSLSKDAKVAYNQLCTKLNIPNVVKMKNQVVKMNRAVDEDDDSNRLTEMKKKHQKRNEILESRKQKKKTRALRIQNTSEGLNNGFSFSDVNLLDLKGNIGENGVDDDDMELDDGSVNQHVAKVNGRREHGEGKGKRHQKQPIGHKRRKFN